MEALGANVILVDGAIEEALTAAADFATQTGAALIEDSKNVGTCEGAGTIGLELSAFGPSLDGVLISLGAGAMATVLRRSDAQVLRSLDESPEKGSCAVQP